MFKDDAIENNTHPVVRKSTRSRSVNNHDPKM